MKLHPHEMRLFFDCELSAHKKTLAHTKCITEKIVEITFQHNNLSKFRWAEILIMLQMRAKNILNKANKKCQEELAGHDFDNDN